MEYAGLDTSLLKRGMRDFRALPKRAAMPISWPVQRRFS